LLFLLKTKTDFMETTSTTQLDTGFISKSGKNASKDYGVKSVSLLAQKK